MAVQILSQSYGPRKPLIECTADSLSDLAGLVCAEGSTATVGGTEYVLDRVNGWVEPGSGGGGGGGSGVLVVHETYDEQTDTVILDKTAGEIISAAQSGKIVVSLYVDDLVSGDGITTEYLTKCEFTDTYSFYFVVAYTSSPRVIIYDAATESDYPVANN